MGRGDWIEALIRRSASPDPPRRRGAASRSRGAGPPSSLAYLSVPSHRIRPAPYPAVVTYPPLTDYLTLAREWPLDTSGPQYLPYGRAFDCDARRSLALFTPFVISRPIFRLVRRFA